MLRTHAAFFVVLTALGFPLSWGLLPRTEQAAGQVFAASGRDRYAGLSDRNQSFVFSMSFRHRLRVCNAYPHAAAFDVYLGRDKLSTKPLKYKTCEELDAPMAPGDRLDFQLAGVSAGSFAVSDLPNHDAVLVLIIYRHDTLSTAVAFESHVFSNLLNAQIMVLDTYKGKARAEIRIQDAATARTARSEELRFDSVVAVNPGTYEIVALDREGEAKARQELVAIDRESYVVIRTGVEAEKGDSFPQELFVFPKSNPDVLHRSGADRLEGMQVTSLAVILTVGLVWLTV